MNAPPRRPRRRIAGLALALAAAGMAGAPAAQPVFYQLDPAHTFVHFEVNHFDTSTLRGRVGPVQGEVAIDPAAGRGRVGLVIDMTTLDTGLRLLDMRLRQADLLDVGNHPQAYFVAERMRFDAGRLVELTGEFTLRGTSAPLTLRASRFACRTEGQAERCGGDFEGELRRSAFGADFGLPLVADRVVLRVQAEGLRRR